MAKVTIPCDPCHIYHPKCKDIFALSISSNSHRLGNSNIKVEVKTVTVWGERISLPQEQQTTGEDTGTVQLQLSWLFVQFPCYKFYSRMEMLMHCTHENDPDDISSQILSSKKFTGTLYD